MIYIVKEMVLNGVTTISTHVAGVEAGEFNDAALWLRDHLAKTAPNAVVQFTHDKELTWRVDGQLVVYGSMEKSPLKVLNDPAR